jgi:hypothetical protein
MTVEEIAQSMLALSDEGTQLEGTAAESFTSEYELQDVICTNCHVP